MASSTSTKEHPTPQSPLAANATPAQQAAHQANRDKAIELALGSIEKQFGKGAIMRLGKDSVAREVSVIPTGSLGADIALGVGELPAAASSRSTARSRAARPR
ncbi:MAG: hypothetical protein R2939_04975 [Kofleriaceae bacterium]